jgi:hypothetical protein
MKKIILFCLLLVSLYSCKGVAPYEKEVLATPKMSLNSDSLINSINDHIYFSREATSGGKGFAGGGCGCN